MGTCSQVTCLVVLYPRFLVGHASREPTLPAVKGWKRYPVNCPRVDATPRSSASPALLWLPEGSVFCAWTSHVIWRLPRRVRSPPSQQRTFLTSPHLRRLSGRFNSGCDTLPAQKYARSIWPAEAQCGPRVVELLPSRKRSNSIVRRSALQHQPRRENRRGQFRGRQEAKAVNQAR